MKKFVTLHMLSLLLSFPSLAQTLNGISVGETVVESYKDWSIRTVKAIANNTFLLTDGYWYPVEEVLKLQDSLNGIFVGEKVIESHQTESIQFVEAIAHNRFFLNDGFWYPINKIHKVPDPSQADCEVGEESGNCNSNIYSDKRSQTRMMEKSDQLNATPATASSSSSI